MKICNFCNTENNDNSAKCVSCGGNSFKQKCNNCGTVFSEGVHCPHCGVKIGQIPNVCPMCQTQYYSNACPNCGYSPAGNTYPTYSAPQPAPPKRKTWLWVLGWIFIFPLPLTLILLKKQNMDKKLKYAIIIAAWVVYALIAIFGGSNNDSNDKKQSSSSTINQVAETIAETKPTQELTEEPTEAPTEKPTEAATEKPTNKATEAPTEKATEAPVKIVFYEYSNNVEAGSNAFVTIQGAPNTEYSIHVFYDSGESEADGLEAKFSDNNGFVTWNWKVGSKTSKGEHTITVQGGGTQESVKFSVY